MKNEKSIWTMAADLVSGLTVFFVSRECIDEEPPACTKWIVRPEVSDGAEQTAYALLIPASYSHSLPSLMKAAAIMTDAFPSLSLDEIDFLTINSSGSYKGSPLIRGDFRGDIEEVPDGWTVRKDKGDIHWM